MKRKQTLKTYYFQFIAIQDLGITQLSACFMTQNTLLFKNTKFDSESSFSSSAHSAAPKSFTHKEDLRVKIYTS